MPSLYGITISVSILSCLLVSEKIFPEKRKQIWDAGLYCVLGGIVGARFYHVLDFLELYLSDPILILKIWNGGLGIWGAIVGGIAGLFIYSKKSGESFFEISDVIATVMPFGQAIGRWGNFFNSELMGRNTKLPWGVNGQHPLFLYESLLNLGLFAFLVKTSGDRKKRGCLTSRYLAGYAVIRFFLEFLRVDPWKIGGLNVAQMVSILALLLSGIIYWKGRRT